MKTKQNRKPKVDKPKKTPQNCHQEPRWLPPFCSASVCEVTDGSQYDFWSSKPSHPLPGRKAEEDKKAETCTSQLNQIPFQRLSGCPTQQCSLTSYRPPLTAKMTRSLARSLAGWVFCSSKQKQGSIFDGQAVSGL